MTPSYEWSFLHEISVDVCGKASQTSMRMTALKEHTDTIRDADQRTKLKRTRIRSRDIPRIHR